MKTFQVNKNIEVVCQWHKTRRAFKHTATLIYKGNERETVKICYLNRTWERYTFESVLEKLLENSKFLSKWDKRCFAKMIKNGGQHSKDDLKTIAMVAKLGDIFGKNQKESNDWKARMLKAGLEGKGLIMPDGWNKLSEGEKEARLNGALKSLSS